MAKKPSPHLFYDNVRFARKWVYCVRCGLVALNNDTTRREMGKPCPGKDEDK